MIAKISLSGEPVPKHWWIYHMSSYSGANTAFNIPKENGQKNEES